MKGLVLVLLTPMLIVVIFGGFIFELALDMFESGQGLAKAFMLWLKSE